jgi:F-type H+-transporting ATPase subunit delta
VIGTVVARRYAKALLETVAERNGNLDAIHGELKELATLIEESRDLRRLLYSPSVRMEIKMGIIEDILQRAGLSEVTQTFVKLLVERGRVRYLQAIADTFEELANERLGRVKVSVTTASPLEEDEIERLSSELSRTTGKKVIVETKVDPSLIGGMVVRVGDRVLDGSLKHQLDALRESLVQG